jgi:hypothetical protein
MSEQGVNGVIIVTTVKGKEKITVNVNSAIDFSFPLCQNSKQIWTRMGWSSSI